MSDIRAVFWDFGGVILSSPFEAFRRYEADRGLPQDFIRGINAENPEVNAWAQLERSDISLDEFDRLFAEESAAKGHRVPGGDVLKLLSGEVRPEMVAALKRIKTALPQACLTNNVASGEGPGMARSVEKAAQIAEIMTLFDCVVESSKAGVRKPEPAFYQIALDRLSVTAEEVVFLDDLGVNLKPARAMGMKTIKVEAPGPALEELSDLLGFALD